MINYYTKIPNQLIVPLEKAEKGCWINIYPPFDKEELQQLSKELNIPINFLIDSLDVDERSRYEQEDGVQLIVLNISLKNPQEEGKELQHRAMYITIPIGIVEVDDYILTISASKNPVIDYLLSSPKNLHIADHNQFVLYLFDRAVYHFLSDLKSIDNQRKVHEKELYYSSRNEELAKLLNLQKSLVYFVTTLRDNELMLMKMQRTDFLKIKREEFKNDFFEDILIDTKQAQEMAQIYTDILHGTMDAFSSIISNNLNKVMKQLTSVTIILMVPTLVASFYGMNVPLLGSNYAYSFPFILLISILLSLVLGWFFMRKRLF